MPVVLGHVLLALSALALLAAGLRVAERLVDGGWPRLIAAIVFAAAAAVVCALGLGLVSLGTSPVALPLAALALWGLARATIAPPEQPFLAEAAAGWAALDRWAQVALGVVAGIVLTQLAWILRWPGLGFDGLVYHLPEVVAWVQDGSPGALVPVLYELPVSNYPVTNEVLLAWASGIASSPVPAATWSVLAAAVLGIAGWAGLRALRVPYLPAGLAVAALVTTPVLFEQLEGPGTDLPALAWLACAAALVAARHPPLLAPALIASALAVGTKTTTAPLAVLVLALGALDWRRTSVMPRLDMKSWTFAVAGVVAVAVGGVWYLRNLVDHGSPLWPFVSGPFGDPRPPVIEALRFSLLDRPGVTLDGNLGAYADALGGALVLLVAGVLSAALVRTRLQLAAAAVTLAAVLVWAAAPVTGAGDIAALADLAGSAIRYLLPAPAAAAVAVALLARRYLVIGCVVLGAAIAWNLVRLTQLPFPDVPRPLWLVSGVLGGGFVAAVWGVRRDYPAKLPTAVSLTAVVLAGAALGLAAPGFAERHGEANVSWDAPVVRWLATQPAYRDGEQPVAAAPITSGVLAGDRLEHRIPVIPPDEGCAAVRRRARDGWVLVRLVGRIPIGGGRDFPALGNAAQCLAAETPAFRTRDLRVYRLSPQEAAGGLEASIRRRAGAPLPDLRCDDRSCTLAGRRFPVTVDTFTTCWRAPAIRLEGCVLS